LRPISIPPITAAGNPNSTPGSAPKSSPLTSIPSMPATVRGECEERFGAVRDALAESLDHDDVGACAAVYLNGEPVADLWGGYADQARTVPWEPGHDHLRLVHDQGHDRAVRADPGRPR
jgi:hypothetical protein